MRANTPRSTPRDKFARSVPASLALGFDLLISFSLTEEQEIARAAAADLARAKLTPAARAADEAGAFGVDLLPSLWGLGLVQTAASGDIPDQPSVLNALVLEELGYGDAAAAVALAATLGLVRAIAVSGSEAQRRDYLPAFADDQPVLAAVAYADAGWFGGASQPMRADRLGGGWRLTGAKSLIPLASACTLFLVLANTDIGVSAFIVARDAEGVSVGEPKGTLGMRALAMSDVVFDGAAVAESARLPGDARRIIDSSRVALTAILSGLSRAVYDLALPYSQQRVVHGEAIGRKQAVAFKLADMHIHTQAMRWMGLRAAAELDASRSATRDASLARRYAAEHGLRTADEGLQIFGGYGYTRAFPLEMYYRNARALSVLDGLVGV